MKRARITAKTESTVDRPRLSRLDAILVLQRLLTPVAFSRFH